MAFADKSPITQVILFDAAGNAIAVQDGVAIPANTPRVLIAGSESGSARTINVDSSGNLAALPLPAGAATEATLDSIKDTDGIKKITDALPTGANILGRTGVRSNTKGSSVAADLTSENVDANTEALHSSLASWFGSVSPTVGQKLMLGSIPITIASDQSAIPVSTAASSSNGSISELLLDGASSNMVVDGSVTPVVFDVSADPVNDIQLVSLRLVFSATPSLLYSGASFGKGGGALANGVSVDIVANGGSFSDQLFFSTINEDFWRLLDVGASPGDGLLAATLPFGGTLLEGGTGDVVSVTINDDLTSGVRGITYFTATLYGVVL